MPEILFDYKEIAANKEVKKEGTFESTTMDGKSTKGLWDYLMRYAFLRQKQAPDKWVKIQIMKYFGEDEIQ